MANSGVPKILIVDDVDTNRFVLKDIIMDMGYQPILTENGEQALKIIERYELSLIISDIAMPVMDGYELCKAIKADVNKRYESQKQVVANIKSDLQSALYKENQKNGLFTTPVIPTKKASDFINSAMYKKNPESKEKR